MRGLPLGVSAVGGAVMSRLRLVWLFGPVLALLCACAAAHDPGGESPIGTGGSAGRPADGDGDAGDGGDGDGGDGDGDGAGDGGGGGGGAGGPAPECSGCEPVDSPFGTFDVCCTQSGACGLDFTALTGGTPLCVERDAPGAVTDACPSQAPSGFPFELPGCCPPSGICGVRVQSFLPLGCVAYDQLAPFAAMGGVALDEVACEP
jgi:hypothetical protein